MDAWRYGDARPNNANLSNLADLLADRGVGTSKELLRRLRWTYGARALLDELVKALGDHQATTIARRMVHYANEMLRFPRISRRPEHNDTKKRMMLTVGTPLW